MTLEKKFILTAGLKNIAEEIFKTKTSNIVTKVGADATVNAGLSPTPAAMLTKLSAFGALFVTRESLRLQQLENTESIKAARTEINDNIVSDWMPTIQTRCAGNVAKAKGLGFGVKGEYDGQSESPLSVTNSYPVIVDCVINVHLYHTIHVINNVAEAYIIPDDAESMQVYETFEEANTTDIKKMSHLGRVKNGKFVNHFSPNELHKEVFYVIVYVPKDTSVAPILSEPYKAMIV